MRQVLKHTTQLCTSRKDHYLGLYKYKRLYEGSYITIPEMVTVSSAIRTGPVQKEGPACVHVTGIKCLTQSCNI